MNNVIDVFLIQRMMKIMIKTVKMGERNGGHIKAVHIQPWYVVFLPGLNMNWFGLPGSLVLQLFFLKYVKFIIYILRRCHMK